MQDTVIDPAAGRRGSRLSWVQNSWVARALETGWCTRCANDMSIRNPSCDASKPPAAAAGISRRSLLQSSALGTVACLRTSLVGSMAWAGSSVPAKANACILIFLEGGPSQLDTFDPKPGASTGGPFDAIETALPGVRFAQHLPRLGTLADKVSIIRTLTSVEGDHERAQSLIHTGYRPNPRLQYPSLGSAVAWRQGDPQLNAPAFVSIGARGEGSILGPQYGPFVIDDTVNPAPALVLPPGMNEQRLARRLTALESFNSQFSDRFETNLGRDLTELTRRVDRMRSNPVFQPYDPAAEEPELFERYGSGVNDGSLARACLTARRLVESGVKFVEIQYGGWDTHADNFNQVQNLSASLDAALATLIEDLQQRGLLDETLVVCVGEFGRTPKINGDNGRDHFPDLFSALIAGGGLSMGQIIGESNDEGTEIQDRPVSVQDFHATLFAAMGIDIAKDYFAPDGRLLRLTNDGHPMKELLAT